MTYLGIIFLTMGMTERTSCAQTPPGAVVSSGRMEQHVIPGASRQQVVIRSPRVWEDGGGEVFVEPNVSVIELAPSDPLLHPNGNREMVPMRSDLPLPSRGPLLQPLGGDWSPELGPFDAPPNATPDYLPSDPIAQPLFNQLLEGDACCESAPWPQPSANRGPTHWLVDWYWNAFGSCPGCCDDGGLGREHVMMAPFEIDITQPMNNIRLRLDNAFTVSYPDRAEYYWSKLRGPSSDRGELSMDYQDLRMMMEVGGERFSVQTEIPIRAIDPVLNANTAGLGDMSITTKTVLVDGKSWQLTQIFRTFMNTGSASHGTGNGHVSMEPGLLCRYKLNERLYAHSDIKYWFPIGGDPIHSGQVLRYGVGFSWLWLDSDTFAVIPTWEMVGWSVLDGKETSPGEILAREVDGGDIFNLYPGLRCIFDPDSDLGIWEIGINWGISVAQTDWYEGLFRVEMRLIY